MTKLLFIRHGESLANGSGFFAGQLDIELSERGLSQAELVADWIKDNYKVDKVYASDLSRAYKTALPVAERFNLPVIKSTELREINSGDWQGKTFNDLQVDFAESYGVWLKDIGKAKTPNGETVKDLYDRIWQAIEKIVNENQNKTIVIATHATPIRAVCCKLKGFSIDDMKSVKWVSNASVSEVVVDNGKWVLSKESIDEYLNEMKTRFPANV